MSLFKDDSRVRTRAPSPELSSPSILTGLAETMCSAVNWDSPCLFLSELEDIARAEDPTTNSSSLRQSEQCRMANVCTITPRMAALSELQRKNIHYTWCYFDEWIDAASNMSA
jgi:hypothetical protein